MDLLIRGHLEARVEVAADPGGVADLQDPAVIRDQAAVDGVVDWVRDAGGLVNDYEDVPLMYALEVVGAVGREARGVVLVLDEGQFRRPGEEQAPEGDGGPGIGSPDLLPDEGLDLPPGRGC